MVQLDADVASFTAGEAIAARYLRVTLASDGDIEVASDTEHEIGVARELAASGQTIGVILTSKSGTMPYVASEAIDVGEWVIPTAGGKVGASATIPAGRSLGMAKTAATADGSELEVIGPPDSGVGP